MRVLLIDDDEDDYVVVRDLLSGIPGSGFDVEWVSTYEAGLEAICRMEHDIFLLDYRLGYRDGLELMKEAFGRGCEAPVIVLTGQGDYEVDVEAMKAGAADYLVKGQITAELLERSIRYSIGQKRAEIELERYRSHLEELVRDRTAQLESSNARLRLENAERRRAEERISEQNAFLNNVLEALTHPFYVIDAQDYSVVMANSAASPGGLPPGTLCYVLTHKEKQPCIGPEHLCPLEIIKRTKQPLSVEHIHIDKDGEPRNVEVHGYPVFDRSGEVVQIIEYALDITERKRMEEDLCKARDELEARVEERTAELARANEALRLEESRLEVLLELSQMRDASEKQIADFALYQQVRLTKSRLGWLGFLSEDETRMTLHAWSEGTTETSAVGDTPVPLSVAETGVCADAVRERRPVIINGFEAHNPPVRVGPLSHSPLSRLMVVPVLDGDQIVAIAAVGNKETDYDGADLRQLTLLMDGMWKLIQRERTEKSLRSAESLAAMGRALTGLAHDMKTPLVAIGGFTRLVRKHMEEDDPQIRRLDIVIRETERLEHMVKEMLDFARPLELHRSPEDINAIIRESLTLLDRIARDKKVAIAVQSSENRARAFMDPMRMKQVIINLVANAIQASPAGEIVTVRNYRSGGRLVVDVIDRGCGIPPEIRETIFSPFYTTKKEGTGLGLSIVKKIVEAHRGRIDILDNDDKGLTFRIIIPNCFSQT